MAKKYFKGRPEIQKAGCAAYPYVVITRGSDESGIADCTTSSQYSFQTDAQAHLWAKRCNDAGYWVDTYLLIGMNSNEQ